MFIWFDLIKNHRRFLLYWYRNKLIKYYRRFQQLLLLIKRSVDYVIYKFCKVKTHANIIKNLSVKNFKDGFVNTIKKHLFRKKLR